MLALESLDGSLLLVVEIVERLLPMVLVEFVSQLSRGSGFSRMFSCKERERLQYKPSFMVYKRWFALS